MDGEIWKDVVGYEGLYQVSNKGRIKSLVKKGSGSKTFVEHIVKLQIHKSRINYFRLQIRMYKDGKGATVSIHRIVAQHFIPNPENKPYIDHIDTNPLNNEVSNLRWVTSKENANNPLTTVHHDDAVRKFKDDPLFIKKQRENQPHAKRVAQYGMDGVFIAEYISQMAAARAVGGDINGISRACKGIHSQAYGYIWKYV